MNQISARPAIEAALRNPNLMAAAVALSENRLEDAEPLLRGHLRDAPTDVAAIRLMAELAMTLCWAAPAMTRCWAVKVMTAFWAAQTGTFCWAALAMTR